MVADKVSVHSRSAQSPEEEGVMWESTGEDTYQLSKIPKEDRGTKITIYLNDDNKEFSEHMRVKFLLQKYSQYINFPLILNPEEGDSEVINDSEAIWLKSKRSVKADEYKDFYKFISYDTIEYLSSLVRISISSSLSEFFKSIIEFPFTGNPSNNSPLS